MLYRSPQGPGGQAIVLSIAALATLSAGCADPTNAQPGSAATSATAQTTSEASAETAASASAEQASAPQTSTQSAAPASPAAAEPPPSAAPAYSAPEQAVPAGKCPSDMVLVAGGTFVRRRPGRKKTVTVPGFCLDKTEVTVRQYKECVKEKKCSPRCLEIGRCTAVPTEAEWPDIKESIRASTFCNGARTDRDDHPVNCVSYEESKGYCEAHKKHLPTGDEWEWAIVGDKKAPVFPWGTRGPDSDEMCWGHPYKRSSTCIPGSFPKDTTRDGIVDMTGNLSEWTREGPADKPRPRLRGASWYAIDDGYVQASMWGFESTSTRSEVFGFRCAKAVP